MPLYMLVVNLKMTNGQLLTMLESEAIRVPKHCLKYLLSGEDKKPIIETLRDQD